MMFLADFKSPPCDYTSASDSATGCSVRTIKGFFTYLFICILGVSINEVADLFILQVQVCSEADADDRLTASGRLKHELQKYSPVDVEDKNFSDICRNQEERTIEVNCIGRFFF